MAAWHCRACNLNYPMTWEPETPCPGCEGRLDYGSHWTPTPGWSAAAERIRNGGAPVTVEEKPVEIAGSPPPSSIRVRYDVASNTHWVSQTELAKAGYLTATLENFHVVELNGKFWELQGYSHGNHEWWIERIKPEEDLAYLADLPTTEPHELWGEAIDVDDSWVARRADG